MKRCKPGLWLYMLIPLLVAALPRPAAALDVDADRIARLDAYLQKEMHSLSVPGMAVAVVRSDRILYMNGFGKADGTGRPVTAQTPMWIGSVSKPITAMAVMQLVDQGKVDLDAPVHTYIPGFQLADADSARITVRHLLTHTSGIAYQDGVDPLLKPARGSDSLAQKVAEYRNLSLTHPIGEYEYSSANYIILGRLVESVSGIPFEAYVQENIFTPLGMQNSFLAADTARQHGMAQGYFPWFGIPVPTDPPYLRFQVPDHNMIASAEDVARFLGVFLNQGRFNGASLLKPETVAVSLQVQSQPPGGSDGYGFGWYVRPGESNKRYHVGWNKHFHADAWLAMDAGLGVVVMANLNNNAGLQHALVEVSHNAYQIMQGNPYQEVGAAFRRRQWMLNTILLMVMLALVAWIWMHRRWRRALEWDRRWFWRKVFLPAGAGLGLSLALGLAVPKLINLSWLNLLTYQPDLGWFALAVLALLAGTAVSHLGLIWWRRTQPPAARRRP